MAGRPKIDLGLTGYDELFMDDAARAENRLPRIYDIPLSEIDEFPDHPFQVRLDEDMDQLVQSIRERGLITPVTLRQKDDGRYEIVSGHRRCRACELAGMDASVAGGTVSFDASVGSGCSMQVVSVATGCSAMVPVSSTVSFSI